MSVLAKNIKLDKKFIGKMIAHFFIFSIMAIFSALMVIASRNTVNSVFFLILDFYFVGCLFIMVGAEFIGMILLIVYVGAVAVLFFFCCNDVERCTTEAVLVYRKKYTYPLRLLVGLLILELLVVVGGWQYKDNLMSSSTLIINEQISNTSINLGMCCTLNTLIFSTFRNNFIISDDRCDYFDF